MNRLRGILMLAGFATLTLPLMPVQQILRWTSPKAARAFPHRYHKLLVRLLGFHITVEGELPQKAALLVANHVSWIDIVAFSAVLPVSFVAKHEVAGWPLFGQLAKLQGSVFIDRDRRHRTGEARTVIARRLQEGDTVMLFPEGTSHDGSSVRRFHSSFFGVAEEGRIPVVPVTIAYRQVNSLPMTRRRRPHFAWYGDMDLVPTCGGRCRGDLLPSPSGFTNPCWRVPARPWRPKRKPPLPRAWRWRFTGGPKWSNPPPHDQHFCQIRFRQDLWLPDECL